MNNHVAQHVPSATQTLDQVSRKLGAAVIATAEYQAFHSALQRYHNDAQAQHLLRDYENTQRTLQLMRQLGSDTTEEAQRLENLQQAIEANQTLKSYFNAQGELVALLRELNEFISERLNLDFAGMTKPKSGCC